MAAAGQLQAGSPAAAVMAGRLSGRRAVPGSPTAAVVPLRLGSRNAVARSPAVAVVALRPANRRAIARSPVAAVVADRPGSHGAVARSQSVQTFVAGCLVAAAQLHATQQWHLWRCALVADQEGRFGSHRWQRNPCFEWKNDKGWAKFP